MSASTSQTTRPMSPHITIWRWGPAAVVSIIHRAAGQGMTFVGLPVLLWFLAAVAGGEASYATFQEQAGSWYGLVVLVGLSWAFFEHMASGLRHFVLDLGAGYELDTNNLWAWLVPVIAIALTAVFWAAILLR